MAFKKLVPESLDDLVDGLPWYNAWRRGVEEPYKERDVLFCQVYDSGIMVVCKEYKGYLHAGSEQERYLLEALAVWAGTKGSTVVLQIQGNKKGKVAVGIDDSRENHRWVVSEGRYTQVAKKSEVESVEVTSANPLLAGSGVHTDVEKMDGNTRSARKPR